MEVISLLKRLMELYQEKDLHVVFIDLAKTYDIMVGFGEEMS